MNNTILTDNKEIETLDLPSWWSDDFPCVATLLKTGFKGHRQLFAADVDVLPGVGFAFYGVTGSFYPDWSEWTFGDLKEAKDVLHSYLDSIDVLRVFFCGLPAGIRVGVDRGLARPARQEAW